MSADITITIPDRVINIPIPTATIRTIIPVAIGVTTVNVYYLYGRLAVWLHQVAETGLNVRLFSLGTVDTFRNWIAHI